MLRARIVEIPAHLDWATVQSRAPERRSSIRVGDTTKQYLFMGFIFRPLAFFVIPGLILLFLAIWTLGSVGVEIMRHYVNDNGGIDPRLSRAFADVFDARPYSFVVGGFALLVSIQLMSIGILAIQNKRYFEEMFHLGTRLLREQLGEVSPRTMATAAPVVDSVSAPPAGPATVQEPSSERIAATADIEALPSP